MSNYTVNFNSLMNINLFVANLRLVEGIDFCALKCGETRNIACGCRHTSACSSVDYKEVPPGQPERQQALDVHNDYREKVASGKESLLNNESASNIMALHYDFELEYIAVCWLRQCIYGHDECRRSSKYLEVGQNIYYNTKPPCDDINMFRWAVDSWYGEVGKVNNTCMEKPEICPEAARFFQVVWANTMKVGCARAEIDGGTCRIVCNYGPGGNIRGEVAYKKGKPASACPQNKTNLKYRSLCGETSLYIGDSGKLCSNLMHSLVLILLCYALI